MGGRGRKGVMTHSLALAEDLPAAPPSAAERAAADFLEALGVDLDDESRRDTPRRMAAMYAELLTPADFHATTFPNDGGYDELVVAPRNPLPPPWAHPPPPLP